MTDAAAGNSEASVQAVEARGTPGAGQRPAGSPSPPRAPLGAVWALTVSAALGLFLAFAPIPFALISPTDLPEPVADQTQAAETLLFVLAFTVILPLVLIAVPRVADRVAARHGPAAVRGLALVLSCALGAALLAAKIFERVRPEVDLPVLGMLAALWCALALILVGTAARISALLRWRPARGSAALTGAMAGALALLVGMAFADLGSISLVVLAAGIAVAVGAFLVGARWTRHRVRGRAGVAIDASLVALLLLAVPNLVVFATGVPSEALQTRIIQFHQNFFLGPANQVLGGGAMLVDTLSQYGVGSIYLLAGWFQLAPIGNGTLALLEGLLSAAVFACSYAVLRLANVSRLLTAAALAVAVAVLVYGLQYPVGGLLQHGAIRFGLPIGVVLSALVAVRGGRLAGIARGIGVAIVGISSIWALEAFAYTLLTALAILAVRSWLRRPAERARWVARSLAQLAAACVAAHVALAALTLLAAGELPDWGWYLNTLREFLVGEIGEVTYDFSPWSPGLAVGAIYLASVAGIVLLMRRNRLLAEREPVLLVALAGTTAYGIGLFSYLVNRSGDVIVPFLSLPAVLVVTLWLSLLLRPSAGVAGRGRAAILASALAVAALLVSVSWSSVQVRFPQSALAHALPGGPSMGEALDRLWNPPPLFPGADEGERLLARYMPGERRSVVLTAADLSVEILMRSGRASEIPFGDPVEDSFVPEDHLPALARAVAELKPGDRILVDEPAARTFMAYLREPQRDPLSDPLELGGLAHLQEWVLKELGARFRLRPVARGEAGLMVVELARPER